MHMGSSCTWFIFRSTLHMEEQWIQEFQTNPTPFEEQRVPVKKQVFQAAIASTVPY